MILFAPHFVGLDAVLARLAMEYPVAMMYAHQKDRVFDRLLYGGARASAAQLFSRQEGIRAALARDRAGRALYYLPDLDFGRSARCSCRSSACRRPP